MKPKVLILRTAGINCDRETEFAFRCAGANAFLYHINYLKTKREGLSGYQIIAIPGGFSYGDDLGAGKIFSLELILWFKDALREFIAQGGLIIGICNGFQVLVKTGVLPDLDFKQKVTLSLNDSGRFEDRWTHLKIQTKDRAQKTEDRRPKTKDRRQKTEGQRPQNIWFRGLPEIINLPVAHGEGKFYADDDILEVLEKNGQIALRYVDRAGNRPVYPLNPNGSLRDIAGITDLTGRILGLMPHPERFIFKHHWPYWKEKTAQPHGLAVFKNAVLYFK
ncbi:MAG: phosphoribosylformylglycinamidine synthase subunit PurQ [Candidatus Omnitrophica bacterium]|nr:phosphoribosylformylglycinamidine synthase subunit PurQ [Candidatus Omnitrophota bacterium]